MGRGGEKEAITFEEVERFGLGGLLDDGESEREQIAEWVARIKSGEGKIEFIESILSLRQNFKAIQRPDTRDEATQLIDLFLDETILLRLVEDNSHFDRDAIFQFAHFLGVISDYTPLVISREDMLHLRASLTSDEALCGKRIDRRQDDRLLPRGSFIHALCEYCEEGMEREMSDAEKEECRGNGLGADQNALVERAIVETAKKRLPLAKEMVFLASNLDDFKDQVGEEIFDNSPRSLASLLLSLDPQKRFANLFYPSKPRLEFSSPDARREHAATVGIHVGALNRLRDAIEMTYPLAPSEAWPRTPEFESTLRNDADEVCASGGILIDTWASYQLEFATRVACRVWPKAVITYMDINLAGDAGDEIVQEIARDLGI